MRTDSHIEHLVAEADRFADLVAVTDPGRPIVTCPGWVLRDLALHVGGLYRWSQWLLAGPVTVETWRVELPIEYPTPGDALAPWIRDGAETLADTASRVDPATPVWAWGNDHHARFWPRRMLFETVVHRLDLALSVDADWAIDLDVAVDGIDEYLEVLPFFNRWGDQLDALRSADERIIGFRSPTGAWRVRMVPTGWFWDRSDQGADALLSGQPADLLAFLYRRSRSGVGIGGDRSLVEHWYAATEF